MEVNFKQFIYIFNWFFITDLFFIRENVKWFGQQFLHI